MGTVVLFLKSCCCILLSNVDLNQFSESLVDTSWLNSSCVYLEIFALRPWRKPLLWYLL
ncbi:hypothetical protein CUMW_285460 [Citrus unshiu]|uniref:Uncharacterized protein n=1 Tax=Citrus unshiu TaxID=55188 RepID=A0A2H5MXP4_CITUN|nr:hypothetical protein CUMW_285460 [Citrus unshiu]